LPKEAVALLKAHRKTQNGQTNPLDLVFRSETGGPLDYNNFQKRVFKPWLRAAKLKSVTFHSLRHAGNSVLASEGHSLKLLQDRLDHSTPAVTFQTYTHLGATEGRKGADTLGKLLSETKRETNGSKRTSNRGARTREKAR
jgi:integrase